MTSQVVPTGFKDVLYWSLGHGEVYAKDADGDGGTE